MGYFIDPK